MQIQAMKDTVQWEPKQLHCSYLKLQSHTLLLSYTSTNTYFIFFPVPSQLDSGISVHTTTVSHSLLIYLLNRPNKSSSSNTQGCYSC